MAYECLKEFPPASAWQAYRDGARHEELLEYAIRQHQEKLSAELRSEQAERSLGRLKRRLRLADDACKSFREVITKRVVDQTQEDWSMALSKLTRWLDASPKPRGRA